MFVRVRLFFPSFTILLDRLCLKTGGCFAALRPAIGRCWASEIWLVTTSPRMTPQGWVWRNPPRLRPVWPSPPSGNSSSHPPLRNKGAYSSIRHFYSGKFFCERTLVQKRVFSPSEVIFLLFGFSSDWLKVHRSATWGSDDMRVRTLISDLLEIILVAIRLQLRTLG